MDATPRLLIIDDEPKLAGLLERYLVRLGYQVEVCVDAESAWERFQVSPDAYAMVITDLTLPGMNGEELLAKMRELRPQLKALLASGYPHVPASPLTGFLQKPFLPQMLADAVKAALGPS